MSTTLHRPDPQNATPSPSEAEVLLRCEHVSKIFCRNLKRSLWYGAQDIAKTVGVLPGRANGSGLLLPEDRHLREGEFWANKDLSFELRRGECLGLIGRNGAGKTTLLKMLNGIIKPDTGKITIKGRMGSLIALGAGFNPILSGRENIVANAMVLGLSPDEIRRRMDEIIDFADLRDFIDSPVRNYSSGMQVRLGFSIATMINPDILILDEVLAVGDASFRHKCFNRLNKLMQRAAVILVSHSMEQIGQLSTRVGLLHNGGLEVFDDIHQGVAAYNRVNQDTQGDNEVDTAAVKAFYPPVEKIDVNVDETVHYGGKINVTVALCLTERINDVTVSFVAINRNEQAVMCAHSSNSDLPYSLPSGTHTISFEVNPVFLHQGQYKWSFGISRKGTVDHVVWFVRAGSFTVVRSARELGDIPYLPKLQEFKVT